jgi:hypothetical protein
MENLKEFIEEAVKSQIELDDKDVLKYAKNVKTDIGMRVSSGEIHNHGTKILKVELKKSNREIRFVSKGGIYTYITNPRYKNEFKHVIGLERGWYGLYDDKYLVRNFGGRAVQIYELKEGKKKK